MKQTKINMQFDETANRAFSAFVHFFHCHVSDGHPVSYNEIQKTVIEKYFTSCYKQLYKKKLDVFLKNG